MRKTEYRFPLGGRKVDVTPLQLRPKADARPHFVPPDLPNPAPVLGPASSTLSSGTARDPRLQGDPLAKLEQETQSALDSELDARALGEALAQLSKATPVKDWKKKSEALKKVLKPALDAAERGTLQALERGDASQAKQQIQRAMRIMKAGKNIHLGGDLTRGERERGLLYLDFVTKLAGSEVGARSVRIPDKETLLGLGRFMIHRAHRRDTLPPVMALAGQEMSLVQLMLRLMEAPRLSQPIEHGFNASPGAYLLKLGHLLESDVLTEAHEALELGEPPELETKVNAALQGDTAMLDLMKLIPDHAPAIVEQLSKALDASQPPEVLGIIANLLIDTSSFARPLVPKLLAKLKETQEFHPRWQLLSALCNAGPGAIADTPGGLETVIELLRETHGKTDRESSDLRQTAMATLTGMGARAMPAMDAMLEVIGSFSSPYEPGQFQGIEALASMPSSAFEGRMAEICDAVSAAYQPGNSLYDEDLGNAIGVPDRRDEAALRRFLGAPHGAGADLALGLLNRIEAPEVKTGLGAHQALIDAQLSDESTIYRAPLGWTIRLYTRAAETHQPSTGPLNPDNALRFLGARLPLEKVRAYTEPLLSLMKSADSLGPLVARYENEPEGLASLLSLLEAVPSEMAQAFLPNARRLFDATREPMQKFLLDRLEQLEARSA